MKKLQILTMSAFLAVISFGSVATSAQAAGIPVVDTANLEQSVQQLVQMTEQLKQLQEQVKTAKSQLENAQEMLSSMSDPRGMMTVFESLFADLKNVVTDDVLSEYGIVDPSTLGLVGEQAEMAQDSIERASEWLAKVETFQEQTTDRVEQLKKAVQKVDDLKDMKDVADFQAKMLTEIAVIGNEQIKASVAAQEAQARKDMEHEQAMQKSRELLYGPKTESGDEKKSDTDKR